MVYLYVFLGGGLGATGRFILSGWVNGKALKLAGINLPYGTMLVNVLGAFIIALFLSSVSDKTHNFMHWKALIVTGFLGGFTTFSSFSYETLLLFHTGSFLAGMLNILCNIILCLAFAYLGLMLGKA